MKNEANQLAVIMTVIFFAGFILGALVGRFL